MRHRKTYMYVNFQQNQVNRSVKTVHTNLLLAIRISKNHAFPTWYPISDIQANLGSIGLLDIKLPQKDIDTDGRHDGRTD